MAYRARAALAGLALALLSAWLLFAGQAPAAMVAAARPAPQMRAITFDLVLPPAGHAHGGVADPLSPAGKPRPGAALQPSSTETAATPPAWHSAACLPPASPHPPPVPAFAGLLRLDPALHLHPGQAPPTG